MNVKVTHSYKIVKMMMCTHTNTKNDGHNTICTDCGIILDISVMTTALDDAIDVISRKIANDILDSGRAHTVCDHTSEDTDDSGTPFCTGCGLMFEDEVVYSDEVYDEVHNEVHNKMHNKVHDKIYNDVHDTGRRHYPRTPAEMGGGAEKVDHKHEIIPKNVKDLITIAKGRGVKGSTSMSEKKLCDTLGLKIAKPDKLAFRNRDTGEEHRFKSIYRASKEMNVNPGSIQYHIGHSGTITIDEIVYDVYNIQTSTG